MEQTVGTADRWRSTLTREAREALAAARRAPRAVVVREVVLQVVAAALAVTTSAIVGDASTVVLVALATALVLLARLRWPAAATVAAGGLITFITPGAWLAAPLVAFSEGRRETSPRRLLLVLACAGALCLALIPLVPSGEGLLLDLLAAAAGALYLLGVPALCGALLGSRRPAARLLAERNAYLEQARSLTVLQARSQERARITAEMHDVLGHRLSLLSVHAGALEVRTAEQAPRLSEQAHLVRSTAVAALDELRATLDTTHVGAGRPPARPGGGLGSEQDVAALAEAWRATGVEVAVTWDDGGDGGDGGDGSPDLRIGRAVDGAVREGLTNVHKHAPGASVAIGVRRTSQGVRVSVRNTAPAHVAPPGSGTRLGLLGLAERARLLGGRAAWGPTRDGGFELVVEVPARPSGWWEAGWAAVPSTTASSLRPPPVQEADVLTWRRTAVVALLAAVLALPTALGLTAVVVQLLLA